MSPEDHLLCLDAAMATFSLHVHARISSLVGEGWYTIGPCGEEALSSAALALETGDSAALHYRHSGVQLARHLNDLTQSQPPEKMQIAFQDLLLDLHQAPLLLELLAGSVLPIQVVAKSLGRCGSSQ